MKKLSISLFTILAIVFAVSSAFTTNHKAAQKAFSFQKWFILKFPSSVTISTFQQTSGTNSFKVLGTYQTSAVEIEDVEAECGDIGNPDVVCAAKINTASSSVLQQSDLTPLTSVSQLVDIRYKDL